MSGGPFLTRCRAAAGRSAHDVTVRSGCVRSGRPLGRGLPPFGALGSPGEDAHPERVRRRPRPGRPDPDSPARGSTAASRDTARRPGQRPPSASSPASVPAISCPVRRPAGAGISRAHRRAGGCRGRSPRGLATHHVPRNRERRRSSSTGAPVRPSKRSPRHRVTAGGEAPWCRAGGAFGRCGHAEPARERIGGISSTSTVFGPAV